jgi:N-acetyl-anhydromuramyl-L-alanine amidase AmpD
MTIPDLGVDERRHSHVLQSPLMAPRGGIMLHYDDSSRDDWALAWFSDPRCTNGYTWLVLDDGRVVELADPAMRTPHAGPCRTPQANSRYYGIAAATNGLVPATELQLAAIARLCAALCRHHHWVDTAPESTPTRRRSGRPRTRRAERSGAPRDERSTRPAGAPTVGRSSPSTP